MKDRRTSRDRDIYDEYSEQYEVRRKKRPESYEVRSARRLEEEERQRRAEAEERRRRKRSQVSSSERRKRSTGEAEQRPHRKMSRKQKEALRKKRRRKRILILVLELLVLIILAIGAYAVIKLDKLDWTRLNSDNLEVYKDTGPYTNIALFGLDSREGELDGGVRSDCIMIASINNDTNEVKIVSVYRDTLLLQEDGEYEKANAAYNAGPESAIALLNRNLDLDIKNYVSVNFNSLTDVIDLLGGIDVEMTEEEVYWTNAYAIETANTIGREAAQLSGEAGMQHLDGIQSVAFSRIRYTDGMDFKRTHRQRIVLEQVIKKAQKADIFTLNKIIDQVFPQISTSLNAKDMMGIAAHALSYKIGEMTGFPFSVTTSEEVSGHNGSYVVPIGLADNVSQLHALLFANEAYQPSEKVQQISQDIISMTGIDPATYGNGIDTSAYTQKNSEGE